MPGCYSGSVAVELAAHPAHSLSESMRSAIEEYIEKVEDREVEPRAQAASERWKAEPPAKSPPVSAISASPQR
jgi:hypothetical protein